MQDPPEDYYEILGVPRTATERQIRSAYRRLAKKYHPDLEAGGNTPDSEAFKIATHAYDILSNAARRERYDRFGDSSEPRPQREGQGRSYTPVNLDDWKEHLERNRSGGKDPTYDRVYWEEFSDHPKAQREREERKRKEDEKEKFYANKNENELPVITEDLSLVEALVRAYSAKENSYWVTASQHKNPIHAREVWRVASVIGRDGVPTVSVFKNNARWDGIPYDNGEFLGKDPWIAISKEPNLRGHRLPIGYAGYIEKLKEIAQRYVYLFVDEGENKPRLCDLIAGERRFFQNWIYTGLGMPLPAVTQSAEWIFSQNFREKPRDTSDQIGFFEMIKERWDLDGPDNPRSDSARIEPLFVALQDSTKGIHGLEGLYSSRSKLVYETTEQEHLRELRRAEEMRIENGLRPLDVWRRWSRKLTGGLNKEGYPHSPKGVEGSGKKG